LNVMTSLEKKTSKILGGDRPIFLPVRKGGATFRRKKKRPGGGGKKKSCNAEDNKGGVSEKIRSSHQAGFRRFAEGGHNLVYT